jgi:CRISPR-associated protein Cmr4
MERANAILGLRAETPIHAGTGASTGVVDLPIQREGHTGWPCVYGSALKGALRDFAEQMLGRDNASVALVFGPPVDGDPSLHAGALSVGDARLALLPVRSLTGHFRWVTCPAALARLRRDAERLGRALDGLDGVTPAQDEALVPEAGGDLFLEELRLTARQQDLTGPVAALAPLMGGEEAEAELSRQIAVVHDDRFAHLVQHATPVAAHVRIEGETKTVAKGGLWYEESLPPETVLYAPLSAAPARGGSKETQPMPAKDVLGAVTEALFGARPYLQVGGNETVGMGWCRTAVIGQEG